MQSATEVNGKKHWFIKYRHDPVEEHYSFKKGKEVHFLFNYIPLFFKKKRYL